MKNSLTKLAKTVDPNRPRDVPISDSPVNDAGKVRISEEAAKTWRQTR